MAKKKKKRAAPAAPATPKKVVNYRRILYLATCFLVAMVLYRVALNFMFFAITYVYEAVAAGLLIWYCLVNQGLGRRELPPDADEAARADHARRLRLGKQILGVFFGVLLTLIIDFIDLYILDYLRQMIVK